MERFAGVGLWADAMYESLPKAFAGLVMRGIGGGVSHTLRSLWPLNLPNVKHSPWNLWADEGCGYFLPRRNGDQRDFALIQQTGGALLAHLGGFPALA